MSALHLTACVSLTVALLGAPGDRAAGLHRGVGGGLPASVPAAPGVPEFALFGWVSPPVESTTDARIAELAGAGMNLTVPAWNDSGHTRDNFQRLDYAAAHGVRCLIWENRFERFLTLDVDTPAGGALLDSIVSDYHDHPAFAGYYLGDEPPVSEFPLLAKLHAALRARDPGHPAWNDLLGPSGVGTTSAWESYVTNYLDQTHASVLCDNHYDFLKTGDRARFVENAAGLGEIARARGIPFWAIVLVVQHEPYRSPTDGEMRWQVAQLLAYGARGIGYFTYWTPPPDTVLKWQTGIIGWDGVRTHWYDFLAQFNARVKSAGEVLAKLEWNATEHAGSVPPGGIAFTPDAWVTHATGRAALGEFADSSGTRYLLVANSDSAVAQTIELELPFVSALEMLNGNNGTWMRVASSTFRSTTAKGSVFSITLPLAPGDFALLRLRGNFNLATPGTKPIIGVSPNPSSFAVQFVLARLGAGARFAVLDAAGRSVWTRDLPAGSTAFSWSGVRDRGGVAPAGIYFARVEDARGSTTTRFTWLGR